MEKAMASSGNVLSFTPPGFNQILHIKFPDGRLPVCEKCKKNYKTRDMCRVRNNHTDPPWSTAYICISLDPSCIDSNNKLIDKPYTVKMNQWHPYCAKKSFDGKTPVCAACKKTNRTRSFCRERHQHKQLPWCAVYVVLCVEEEPDIKGSKENSETKMIEDREREAENPQKETDAQTEQESDTEKDTGKEKVEEKSDNEESTEKGEKNGVDEIEKTDSESLPVIELKTGELTPTLNTKSEPGTSSEIVKEDPETQTKNEEGSQNPEEKSQTEIKEEEKSSPVKEEPVSSKEDEESDDINKLDASRTFLVQVSSKKSTIQWLDLADLNSLKNMPYGYPNGQTLTNHQPSLMTGSMTGMNPPYYSPLLPLPGLTQQQALQMQQQQHFLQMQQRQFAAQQAALQSQFPMLLNPGQQGATNNTFPANQQQMPVQSSDTQQQLPDQNAPTPVNPAQMQQQPGMVQNDTSVKVQNEQGPPQQQQQQHQAKMQAQWQAQMLYQQQLYQQQLQMQPQGNSLIIQQQGTLLNQPFVPQSNQFGPMQPFQQVQVNNSQMMTPGHSSQFPMQVQPNQNSQGAQNVAMIQPLSPNLTPQAMGDQMQPNTAMPNVNPPVHQVSLARNPQMSQPPMPQTQMQPNTVLGATNGKHFQPQQSEMKRKQSDIECEKKDDISNINGGMMESLKRAKV